MVIWISNASTLILSHSCKPHDSKQKNNDRADRIDPYMTQQNIVPDQSVHCAMASLFAIIIRNDYGRF